MHSHERKLFRLRFYLFLIFRCILSTDMARHNEILDKFRVILADGFSFENEAHKSMVKVHVSA